MMDNPATAKRTFTLDEARALLPEVKRLTHAAHDRVAELVGELPVNPSEAEIGEELVDEVNRVIAAWVQGVVQIGAEAKGLWLVDFDCGHGYYCWRYPEEGLAYYHSYEDGFAGRMKII